MLHYLVYKYYPYGNSRGGQGLVSTDDKFVFVAGSRGMLNLPGGGIDSSEDVTAAFYREAQEEIGVKPNQLQDVYEAFCVAGETVSKAGVRRMA